MLGDNGIGLRVLSAEAAVDRGNVHLAPTTCANSGRDRGCRRRRTRGRGCELVLVLGGDGTFLRAAELARNVEIPVLGVNLGRIGFLAEAEADSIDRVLEHVVSRDYRVEERMTLDVVVRVGGRILNRGWALNEASLEKGPRLGVLGAVLEVDGRPVSAFGCDGVLVATPTGSTAWAFSAGGRSLWPDLEAILVVPNNAHALFARPMVTSPDAAIAIEVEATGHDALVFCDGRREMVVPAGGRLEGHALRHTAEVGAPGRRPVHRSPGTQVPAAGHGLARTVVLSEIRIESLGAISTATAEFDRGLTVLTGETGTGKTMVVTGLHLLGGARADATRIRSGADRAVVEGRSHRRTRRRGGHTGRRDSRRVRRGPRRGWERHRGAFGQPQWPVAGISRWPQRCREG